MMTAGVARRAQELATARTPFVTATVVRAQRPTSALAGNVAIVLGDGTVEGFIGGVCAEQSVRAYALEVMESEEAVLLRILPEPADGGRTAGEENLTEQDGAIIVQNSCLSGGAIEVFLEPVVPGPRVTVVGETPIAVALLRLGSELGLDVVSVDGATFDPGPGDLGLVVASHGRDELETLRLALGAAMPYIGLVASRRRGAGVIAELRAAGMPVALVATIDVPAGIDIGARTPAEIALSILARIVEVRRGAFAPTAVQEPDEAPSREAADRRAGSPALVVDPICGMTIAAAAGTLSLEHGAEVVYFCSDSCKATFEAQREHAITGD